MGHPRIQKESAASVTPFLIPIIPLYTLHFQQVRARGQKSTSVEIVVVIQLNVNPPNNKLVSCFNLFYCMNVLFVVTE